MSKKGYEGNSVGEAATLQRELVRKMSAIMMVDQVMRDQAEAGVYISGIRFRAPTDERPEWLAVVSMENEDGYWVGFHNGATFEECLSGLITRLRGGLMKWLPDSYKQ